MGSLKISAPLDVTIGCCCTYPKQRRCKQWVIKRSITAAKRGTIAAIRDTIVALRDTIVALRDITAVTKDIRAMKKIN